MLFAFVSAAGGALPGAALRVHSLGGGRVRLMGGRTLGALAHDRQAGGLRGANIIRGVSSARPSRLLSL